MTNMGTWIAAVFALACLLKECKCFTLVADPTFQHVGENATLKFMCQTDVPLTACQVSNLDTESNVYSDLKGVSTHYWGTGLADGQCGYSYAGPQISQTAYWYACRARDQNGEWQYATSVSFKEGKFEHPIKGIHSEYTGFNLDGVLTVQTPPEKLIVPPGTEVELVYTATEPLSDCQFKMPRERFNWLSKRWLALQHLDHLYSIDDSELAQGRCKLIIHNVTAEQSGYIKSHIISQKNDNKQRHFMDLTLLIVTQAPSAPVLTLNNANGHYSSGDVMLASCHVGLARPVARVTWILNNDVIQGEPEDFTTWPWDYEAGEVTWKLKHTVTMNDEDKELVCRVHHPALLGGWVDLKTRLTVAWVKGRP